MSTPLDPDAQPIERGFNTSRRLERDVSELLGLAKGMLADGVVTPEEASFLRDWLKVHQESLETWPVSVVSQRLARIFADGQVSPEEQEDLKELLSDLVGGRTGILAGDNTATTLPLDHPQPAVIFPGHVFVLTGKFAFGPRTACEAAVRALGGESESTVTRRISYLVIGTFGSRDWVHTSHGRKIEKAVKYRSAGREVSILGEDHWARAL